MANDGSKTKAVRCMNSGQRDHDSRYKHKIGFWANNGNQKMAIHLCGRTADAYRGAKGQRTGDAGRLHVYRRATEDYSNLQIAAESILCTVFKCAPNPAHKDISEQIRTLQRGFHSVVNVLEDV